MSGLIVLVLFRLLFGVVEPGMGELILQTAFTFSLSDVVEEDTEVGAAPTTGGYDAGCAKDQSLSAVAL